MLKELLIHSRGCRRGEMYKELTEIYRPERVLHREEQTKKIKECINNFKNSGIAENLILYGKTGNGKTESMNKVLGEQENHYSYVTGSNLKTTVRILRGIFDLSYGTEEKLLSEGIQSLRKNPRTIIIDEVNKVLDIKTLFDDLNTIFRETGCHIIMITNRRGLIEAIPDDARKTLNFQRVEFSPYDKLQIQDILIDRYETIKKNNKDVMEIPEGALDFLSAKICKDNLSIRNAFFIMGKCFFNKDFSEKFIYEVLDYMKEEDWKIWFEKQNESIRKIMAILIYLKDQDQEISTNIIQEFMSDFSPSWFSRNLDYLENEGIIKSTHENEKGNKRIIIFSDQRYNIFKNFVEEKEIYNLRKN